MKTKKCMMVLRICVFFTLMAIVTASSVADVQAVEVGRIYYIEGDVLRYIPDENDWVAVVKDVPFAGEDAFYTGNEGKAEMIVPNGSWIRSGNNTQIQFIALESDLADIDVASGVARFYNKGSDTVIKATSPFGYVLGDPGTVFDFYVGENSVEVVAVKGTVSFIRSEPDAKYDVATGSPSILADENVVSVGDGIVDPDWDAWNQTRESIWSTKLKVRPPSAEYLPSSLVYEADVLDENGKWEMVAYEGKEYWFWRPTTVSVSWSPFTIGVWTDWGGDQTWIPGEPFGYITHHYGNWVYIGKYWYWAPPVAKVRVGLPLLDVSFFWCPGRVLWVHSGVNVGWVPLAPHEIYYSHRNWGGPHHFLVTHSNVTQININIKTCVFSSHAIIVNQSNFYGVANYRNVRVTNINNTTIINNYKVAPVINNTVINNYTVNKQRYNYTNVTVKEKPHSTVVNRIQDNKTRIQQTRKENAAVLQQQVKSIEQGKINREARVEAPKATNYIVPANDVNRPKSEIRLQQTEVKTKARAATGTSSGAVGKSEQKPASQPGRGAADRSTQQDRSTQSGRGAPDRSTQQDRSTQSGRGAADRSTQEDRSTQSGRGAPDRSTQEDRPTQPQR